MFGQRRYRIPADARKSMISKFYMVMLKRHVESTAHLTEAFQAALQRKRDMQAFLESFGCDAADVRMTAEEEASAVFVGNFGFRLIKIILSCWKALLNILDLDVVPKSRFEGRP